MAWSKHEYFHFLALWLASLQVFVCLTAHGTTYAESPVPNKVKLSNQLRNNQRLQLRHIYWVLSLIQPRVDLDSQLIRISGVPEPLQIIYGILITACEASRIALLSSSSSD